MNGGGSAIRRLYIPLARDGVRLNHKCLFRIYREERLGVPKRAVGSGRSERACP